ncbi:hypothetical protein CAOG_07768 [Capsaspora owczarzaki ATCC 30864]|uniref:Uncharacterized protein n=1 Tax=Capsaspora owczarzaki (strain ATCC 30864) TaxID=595528 RepID=A0A0D2WXW0_CAPO3|nr:hypothetical protein CAOG_07768 [Capsaspora owczarzaki ATCC 30864]KJE97658.1 hypothetical protein CAOG_007768 [Capsaspora owczarzaki ATCC 30864]|eukprot:XP_004342841.1 hypothetical protein CAOG_07768 [Capsaspora owczarzaki ATCC 30864]
MVKSNPAAHHTPIAATPAAHRDGATAAAGASASASASASVEQRLLAAARTMSAEHVAAVTAVPTGPSLDRLARMACSHKKMSRAMRDRLRMAMEVAAAIGIKIGGRNIPLQPASSSTSGSTSASNSKSSRTTAAATAAAAAAGTGSSSTKGSGASSSAAAAARRPSGHSEAVEVFSMALISQMTVPDDKVLEDTIVVSDKWRNEYNNPVQVPSTSVFPAVVMAPGTLHDALEAAGATKSRKRWVAAATTRPTSSGHPYKRPPMYIEFENALHNPYALYDLDETDTAWLALFNKERRRVEFNFDRVTRNSDALPPPPPPAAAAAQANKSSTTNNRKRRRSSSAEADDDASPDPLLAAVSSFAHSAKLRAAVAASNGALVASNPNYVLSTQTLEQIISMLEMQAHGKHDWSRVPKAFQPEFLDENGDVLDDPYNLYGQNDEPVTHDLLLRSATGDVTFNDDASSTADSATAKDREYQRAILANIRGAARGYSQQRASTHSNSNSNATARRPPSASPRKKTSAVAPAPTTPSRATTPGNANRVRALASAVDDDSARYMLSPQTLFQLQRSSNSAATSKTAARSIASSIRSHPIHNDDNEQDDDDAGSTSSSNVSDHIDVVGSGAEDDFDDDLNLRADQQPNAGYEDDDDDDDDDADDDSDDDENDQFDSPETKYKLPEEYTFGEQLDDDDEEEEDGNESTTSGLADVEDDDEDNDDGSNLGDNETAMDEDDGVRYVLGSSDDSNQPHGVSRWMAGFLDLASVVHGTVPTASSRHIRMSKKHTKQQAQRERKFLMASKRIRLSEPDAAQEMLQPFLPAAQPDTLAATNTVEYVDAAFFHFLGPSAYVCKAENCPMSINALTSHSTHNMATTLPWRVRLEFPFRTALLPPTCEHELLRFVRVGHIAVKTRAPLDVVLAVVAFWIEKKRARNGHPLLPALRRPTLIDRYHALALDGTERRILRADIRRDLEQLRVLCDRVKRREKLKFDLMTTHLDMFQRMVQLLAPEHAHLVETEFDADYRKAADLAFAAAAAAAANSRGQVTSDSDSHHDQDDESESDSVEPEESDQHSVGVSASKSKMKRPSSPNTKTPTTKPLPHHHRNNNSSTPASLSRRQAVTTPAVTTSTQATPSRKGLTPQHLKQLGNDLDKRSAKLSNGTHHPQHHTDSPPRRSVRAASEAGSLDERRSTDLNGQPIARRLRDRPSDDPQRNCCIQ